MTRHPKTLRKTLLMALAIPGGFFVGVFGVLLLVHPASTQSTTPAADLPPSPIVALINEHDCWTGEAPADMEGQIPGHVVVTLSDDTLRYGGDHFVGLALDQIFNDKDHGLIVHAFCR